MFVMLVLSIGFFTFSFVICFVVSASPTTSCAMHQLCPALASFIGDGFALGRAQPKIIGRLAYHTERA